MKLTQFTTSILAAGLLIGCNQAANTAENVATKASETVQKTAEETVEKTKSAAQSVKEMAKPGVDISAAPSGTYTSEPGHTYLAFTYSHKGFSTPILRWGTVDATLELDSENPENSELSVSIPVSSIDSGVEAFDKHLASADFFDAENHPTITFKSTDMKQLITGSGRVTGDLTIKGVTKPITLDVKLNKIGKAFRTNYDLFGISATGRVHRAEFGVDKYGPTANEVDLQIEVEFQKVE